MPAATSAQEAPTEAPAAEPKRGGIFRMIGTEWASLDPPGAEWDADYWLSNIILCQGLYGFDKACNLVPVLAADMPTLSDDALVYTISLRKGVKFHNGREMVADDVKFSLERAQWPEVYNWAKTYLANVQGVQEVQDGKTKDVSGIKVLDAYTVQISLVEPQAIFPLILTVTPFSIIPKQETLDAGQDWGISKLIGTGPFKFVSWAQGQKAVFERNPDYWKPGLPYLDGIEVHQGVESNVGMLRWENDEVEYLPYIPSEDLGRVLTDPAYADALRSGPTNNCTRLYVNPNVKPFDDVRVRQAVYMAINKDAIRKVSAQVRPLDNLYVPSMPQYEADRKNKWEYDLEKAKALLSEAGYAEGFKGLSIGGEADSAREVIQANLKEIGFEAEIVTMPSQDQLPMLRTGEIQMGVSSWTSVIPDAFDFVAGFVTCSSTGEHGYNFGQYCNPQVDELMAKAEKLATLDPERLAAYRRIQEIVLDDDAVMLPLYNPEFVRLSKGYVRGDNPHCILMYPDLEEAWFDR